MGVYLDTGWFPGEDGLQYRIRVEKEGYAGDVYEMRLGDPAFMLDIGDPSHDINETLVGGELAFNLLVASEVRALVLQMRGGGLREYPVKLYRGSLTSVFWEGFLDTEFSPGTRKGARYAIALVARDGIRSASEVDMVDADGEPYEGYVAASEAIATALSKTGHSFQTIQAHSRIRPVGSTRLDPLAFRANLSRLTETDRQGNRRTYKAGEVLRNLLGPLAIRVLQFAGMWRLRQPQSYHGITSATFHTYDGSGVWQHVFAGQAAYADLSGVRSDPDAYEEGGRPAAQRAIVGFAPQQMANALANGSFEFWRTDGFGPKNWTLRSGGVEITREGQGAHRMTNDHLWLLVADGEYALGLECVDRNGAADVRGLPAISATSDVFELPEGDCEVSFAGTVKGSFSSYVHVYYTIERIHPDTGDSAGAIDEDGEFTYAAFEERSRIPISPTSVAATFTLDDDFLAPEEGSPRTHFHISNTQWRTMWRIFVGSPVGFVVRLGDEEMLIKAISFIEGPSGPSSPLSMWRVEVERGYGDTDPESHPEGAAGTIVTNDPYLIPGLRHTHNVRFENETVGVDGVFVPYKYRIVLWQGVTEDPAGAIIAFDDVRARGVSGTAGPVTQRYEVQDGAVPNGETYEADYIWGDIADSVNPAALLTYEGQNTSEWFHEAAPSDTYPLQQLAGVEYQRGHRQGRRTVWITYNAPIGPNLSPVAAFDLDGVRYWPVVWRLQIQPYALTVYGVEIIDIGIDDLSYDAREESRSSAFIGDASAGVVAQNLANQNASIWGERAVTRTTRVIPAGVQTLIPIEPKDSIFRVGSQIAIVDKRTIERVLLTVAADYPRFGQHIQVEPFTFPYAFDRGSYVIKDAVDAAVSAAITENGYRVDAESKSLCALDGDVNGEVTSLTVTPLQRDVRAGEPFVIRQFANTPDGEAIYIQVSADTDAGDTTLPIVSQFVKASDGAYVQEDGLTRSAWLWVTPDEIQLGVERERLGRAFATLSVDVLAGPVTLLDVTPTLEAAKEGDTFNLTHARTGEVVKITLSGDVAEDATSLPIESITLLSDFPAGSAIGLSDETVRATLTLHANSISALVTANDANETAVAALDLRVDTVEGSVDDLESTVVLKAEVTGSGITKLAAVALSASVAGGSAVSIEADSVNIYTGDNALLIDEDGITMEPGSGGKTLTPGAMVKWDNGFISGDISAYTTTAPSIHLLIDGFNSVFIDGDLDVGDIDASNIDATGTITQNGTPVSLQGHTHSGLFTQGSAIADANESSNETQADAINAILAYMRGQGMIAT